ncbi:hypothetical protein [Psychrobacter maritimus]|jgi:hypothetical protein|uniref:hypothetical protein n=1 Tax=Psychrobacter maritimus TaxID=256325 RepID=UPI003569A4ED
MNKITANVGLTKARQALWIALFASIVGVTACSNEREDVAADSTEVTDEVVVDEASEEGTEVVETGMTADGMSGNDGEQKADDTVTVNESNANLDQTPADGVQ